MPATDHIRIRKAPGKPLPDPPKLVSFMTGNVLTKRDAESYDKALKDWWKSVQFTWDFDRSG